MRVDEIDYVFYHSPCPDGHFAAWAMFDLSIPVEKLVGMMPSTAPHVDVTDKNILCADYCPPREFFDRAGFKRCLVLDHHISNERMLKSLDMDNVEYTFDAARSGCQITWDYFHPGGTRPHLFDYVADRDLWTRALPHTEEVNAMIHYYGTSLHEINWMVNDPGFIERASRLGTIPVNMRNREVSMYSHRDAIPAVCEGYEIWIVDCPGEYRSDVGNALVKRELRDGKMPAFAAMCRFDLREKKWWISLRGAEDSMDLTKIAEKFGGGGHEHACGFGVNHLEEAFKF